MAAFFIQFFLNLLDIGIFWYYLNTFHNKKRVPAFVCMPLPVLLAAVWAWVNRFGYPFANLLALATVLSVLSLLFYGGLLQKVTGVIVFIGAGILVEPAGFILLQVLQYSPPDGEMYKYYFVAALGEMWCHLSFLQGGKAERDKFFKTAGRFYMVGAGGICFCCYGLLFHCNGFFGIRKCKEPCYVPLYHSFCHTYILFGFLYGGKAGWPV